MKLNFVRFGRRWARTMVLVGVSSTPLGLAAQPATAEADSQTCATTPAIRELDFWLGDWSVTYPGATMKSSSTVSLDLDKCVVVEKWDEGKGHRGENLFAYSADDKSWHGIFADNEGRVHVFEGKVAAGIAAFYGPSRGPNGQAVLNRIRIAQKGPNEVEQTWEKSTDNGATWNAVFSGEYSRKNR